ncbi:MAG: hypothetical protein WCK28_00110 [Burkholderiales bacterium]|jgi:hypothetical protein
MTREPIYAALFARLSAAAAFQTASRRLKHWTDTPGGEQPALFMAQRRETVMPATPVPGLPPKYLLEVDVYVYAKARSNAAPGPILNPLLDAIDAAMAGTPATGGKNTLGGLCEHAWVEGVIDTDEGTLGDQAVAVVPIRILTT